MIELDSRNRASSGDAPRNIPIIGIGGAGGNALDRLALDGVAPASLVAVNSDAQALAASVAGEKIQLGPTATRGLGCGGDPELGRCAAEESAHQMRAAFEGADAVILVAGLGGGTGSGVVPLAAELAHEAGALVIAVVTLPFGFEGKRRAAQANEALAELQRRADAVICFENDRMGEIAPAASGIQAAFTAVEQTLSQCIQVIEGVLNGSEGLIPLGLGDLAAVLQDMNARCLFGYGQAGGKNRAFDALARALKNPLMDKGRLLRDCETVLVRVSGGQDLTLDEVQLLMEEFNRYVNDHTRILFGAVVEPALAGQVGVCILSSIGGIESVPVRHACAPRLERSVGSQVTPPRPAPEPVPEEESERGEAESGAGMAEVAEPFDAFEAEAAEPETQEIQEEEAAAFALEPTGADEQGLPVVHSAEEEPELQVPEAASPAQPVERRHQKPRGLRTPVYQGSLFGEEPAASPERIAPPVPGRMLRHPFPQPEPVVAEPPMAHAPVHPEPPAEPPVAVPVSPNPQPVREPEPAPEAEPMAEAEPIAEPAAMAQNEQADPVPRAPEPAPVPPRPQSLVRRIMHRTAAPEPELIPAGEHPSATSAKPPQQEVMQFEPVTRGRFEKSEPTIVDGQDLDVPTYLRRRLKLR